MGGLIYTVALKPLNPAHPVHNGCDKGLERLKISVRRQGLEDVGEVEARVAVGHLHQHLLKSSRADIARLVDQLLWDQRESWIRGCSTSRTIPSAGLQDYEDTRLKTSSRVRKVLSLAWKASLAMRIFKISYLCN